MPVQEPCSLFLHPLHRVFSCPLRQTRCEFFDKRSVLLYPSQDLHTREIDDWRQKFRFRLWWPLIDWLLSAKFGEGARKHWENNQCEISNPPGQNGRARENPGRHRHFVFSRPGLAFTASPCIAWQVARDRWHLLERARLRFHRRKRSVPSKARPTMLAFPSIVSDVQPETDPEERSFCLDFLSRHLDKPVSDSQNEGTCAHTKVVILMAKFHLGKTRSLKEEVKMAILWEKKRLVFKIFWGAAPYPAGELTAPPRPPAGLKPCYAQPSRFVVREPSLKIKSFRSPPLRHDFFLLNVSQIPLWWRFDLSPVAKAVQTLRNLKLSVLPLVAMATGPKVALFFSPQI